MATTKPRIATYTTEQKVHDFRMIAAEHDMSMSQYLEKMVDEEIKRWKENKKKT